MLFYCSMLLVKVNDPSLAGGVVIINRDGSSCCPIRLDLGS
jgi:hypothetical protein